MACCRKSIKAAYIYASLPIVSGGKHIIPSVTLVDGHEEDEIGKKPPTQGRIKHRLKRDKLHPVKMLNSRAKVGDITERDTRIIEANGRITLATQTGLYLYELSDAVEVDEFGVQTEQFVDRPPSPLLGIAKTGTDVATQIESWELFDFYTEVVPLLEVLLNKTMERSLMEVMEEEELAEIRAKQAIFEEVRNADLAEVERLEERNRRRREEQMRRRKQAEYAALMRQQTMEKIAARSFVRAYMDPLLPNTFEQLTTRGYFYDDAEMEVKVNFLDGLVERALQLHSLELRARIMVDGIIREAVTQRHRVYRELGLELMIEALVEQVLPALRTRLSLMTLDQMVALAISRLETAAAARKQVLQNVTNEVAEMLIDQMVERVVTKLEMREADQRYLLENNF